MVNNRTCFFCGKKYSYCPTCAKDKLKPSWFAMFCSEECLTVDGVMSDYSVGNINEDTAKEKLRELKADKIAIQNADTKAQIDKLMNVKKVIKSAPKKDKRS